MSTHVVVGLAFGDEGKGTLVDHLVRRDQAAAVVRYGGGPQATHHVVLPDGRWHGFSQFGAGTFVDGVATHLTQDVLVEPVSLLREDEVLREKGVHDAMSRLTIDPRAAVVLPYHKMIGQLAELARGGERHGSVGLGVGEAARERAAGGAIRLADARDGRALRVELASRIAERLTLAEQLARQAGSSEADERLAYFRRELDVERLARILHGFVTGYANLLALDETRLPQLASVGPLVLEGAQGVLLDPVAGFPPFVTKSPVIPSPAASGPVRRIGVMRAYAHRHGPGPLPSEDAVLDLPEQHNKWNRWQGSFRVGPLDLVLARYAVSLANVDTIALTCLDRLANTGEVRIVTSYEFFGPSEPWFADAFDSRGVGDRVHIDAIRPGATAHAAEVARVLGSCRPSSDLRVAGWSDLASVRTRRDLPGGVTDLIGLVESLGVAVSCVSIGATWQNKIDL